MKMLFDKLFVIPPNKLDFRVLLLTHYDPLSVGYGQKQFHLPAIITIFLLFLCLFQAFGTFTTYLWLKLYGFTKGIKLMIKCHSLIVKGDPLKP